MKKTVLVSLILTVSLSSLYAQSKEVTIAYFDKNLDPAVDSTTAAYYRTIERKDSFFTVRDYTTSRTLLMQAECTAFLPVLIFNGNVAEYYENGNVKTEGIYKDNKPIGIFQYFYNTGTLKERREYAADGIHYLESFSENGESLYINGKGLASEPADNGIQYLEIENHKCVARFTVDNANDTLYTQTDTPAKYRGGDERMLKDISKWIRLPSSAWRTGVNGQVFVSIVVGKTGAVEGVRLVQGFNKECDAEAVRVASLLKDWTPARHKGKTVRSAFVLPIKFRG